MSKKPWPGDAIMLVASGPLDAVIDPNEPTEIGQCRDCGADVLYRLSSMKVSMDFEHRCGRPVKFFCLNCCITYEWNSIGKLIDMRPGINVVLS